MSTRHATICLLHVDARINVTDATHHVVVPRPVPQVPLRRLGGPRLVGGPAHLGLAGGDVSGSAQKVLGGNVGAAQPSGAPGGGVKGVPAVHDAEIVEQHALALLHLVAVHGVWVIDQALEDAGRRDPVPQINGAVVVAVAALEGGAPVHAREAVAAVVVDDAPLRTVKVAVLAVLVRDTVLRQGRHPAARLDKGPEQAARSLAVAEEGFSARAGVVHAVEDLDHGRRGEVAEVLVQAQAAARVGHVLGVGLGAHVKGPAVEGLADVGDARGDADDGGLVARDVAQKDYSEAEHVDDHVPEGGGAGLHEGGVVDLADVLGQNAGVPVLDAGPAEDGLFARCARCAGGARVPASERALHVRPGENHLVALAGEAGDVVGEGDGEAVLGCARRGYAYVGGDLGRRKVLLARGRVLAGGAGAAVAERGRLESSLRAMAVLGAATSQVDVLARPGDGHGIIVQSLFGPVDELSCALGDLVLVGPVARGRRRRRRSPRGRRHQAVLAQALSEDMFRRRQHRRGISSGIYVEEEGGDSNGIMLAAGQQAEAGRQAGRQARWARGLAKWRGRWLGRWRGRGAEALPCMYA